MVRSLLFIIAVCFACPQLQAQKLVNPSFSVYNPSDSAVCEGWKKHSKYIYYDTTRANSAPGCVYIYNTEDGRSVCTQVIQFTPEKVKEYNLKLAARVETRRGNAGAWVKIFDKKGTLVSYDAMPENILIEKKKWAAYAINFRATPDIAKIEVAFYLSGKGKAWFDDFGIEEINSGSKKPSKIAKQYLKEVYTVIKNNSWYKDSVNLDELHENALQIAAGAENVSDCYEAVIYMLDRLGDNHAQFYDPVTAKNWIKENKQNDIEVIYPTATLLEDKYVHILLPGIVSNTTQVLTAYADTLHKQLYAIDKKKIQGWIVDLRENVGGNATAMLAAIGPLLPEGTCGYYFTNAGKKPWTYKNGAAHIDTTTVTISKPYLFANKDLKVAVLTSSQTYGAAEAAGVALKSLPNIYYVGEATAGATISQKVITLSNGAVLFLTTGVLADSKGVIYDGRLVPNAYIRPLPGKDYCIAKAIMWLDGAGGGTGME